MVGVLLKTASFPVTQLQTIVSGKSMPERKPLVAPPKAGPFDHVVLECATIPKLIVAFICWLMIESFGFNQSGMTLSFALHIIVRDMFITWVLGGGWDYLLYFSPFAQHAVVKGAKINKDRPSWDHFKFCMFWSSVSTLVAAGQEIAYFILFSPGSRIPLWTLITLAWILTMPYWRIAHFYAIHRSMHPWKTQVIPDYGKVLYNLVHSLHHKSYNPSAWSGISMHPIESALYYSVAFIPAWFGAHPLVFLLTKHDCTLGAMWGHDGFSEPGSASYGHYLHHAYLQYNYGENYVPLDAWFGSHLSQAMTDGQPAKKSH